MNNNSKGRKVFLILFLSSLVLSIAFAVASCYYTPESQNVDVEEVNLIQLEPIADDAPVAVIQTSLGIIKAVLYPEHAPKSVENFIELAQSGYYDGTYIYSVENDRYFAAGSPNKDGTLNEDYNAENESVEMETDSNLWPFKGAFCLLPAQVDTGLWDKLMGNATYNYGSRFLVVNTIEMTEDVVNELLEVENGKQISEAFIEHGGIPNFAQQMTIFAQTYEGFDVIDEITAVQIDAESEQNAPVEDILIESVKISTYAQEQDESAES